MYAAATPTRVRAPWLMAKMEALEGWFVGVVGTAETEVATTLVGRTGVEVEAIVLVHGAIDLIINKTLIFEVTNKRCNSLTHWLQA